MRTNGVRAPATAWPPWCGAGKHAIAGWHRPPRVVVCMMPLYDTRTRRESLTERMRRLRALLKTAQDPALRRTTRSALRALTSELAAFDNKLSEERR